MADSLKVPKEQFEAVIRALLNTPPMPASETAPGLPVACEDLAGLLLFGPFVLASVTLLSEGQTSCCQPLRTIAYRATAYFAYRGARLALVFLGIGTLPGPYSPRPCSTGTPRLPARQCRG